MYKRFYHNSSPAGLAATSFEDDLESAIEYAGFTDLHVSRTGDTVNIYQGAEDTNSTRFVQIALTSNTAYNYYYMNSEPAITGSTGVYNTVIGTKKAIALFGAGANEDGHSHNGFIITKSTDGKYVLICDNNGSFNAPKIASRGTSANAFKTLNVTTVYDYSTTTLVNFPTVNDGQTADYVDTVFMAVTGMLTADGECKIDGETYFCAGGVWYMKD